MIIFYQISDLICTSCCLKLPGHVSYLKYNSRKDLKAETVISPSLPTPYSTILKLLPPVCVFDSLVTLYSASRSFIVT